MKRSKQKERGLHSVNRADKDVIPLLRVSRTAAVAVLALLTLLVYANSLAGKFVFDDTVIVQDNPSIQGLDAAHLKEIFGRHYWAAAETRGGLYRPVVMLSYAVNYAVGGSDPTGYHFVNLLLHALNGILVFLILEALFGRRALSFLTALLFILHPIRTEGVASIVGRTESLSACFALVSWYLYIRYRKGAGSLWLWIASVSFVLAALSKESAFAFVALLPLTDYLFGDRKLRSGFMNRAAVVRYIPFGMGIAIALLLRYGALGGLAPLYINPRSNPLALAAPWPRFLTATNVFARYLGLLIWPVALSADYSFNQVPVVTSVVTWAAAVPLFLLVVIVVLLVWLRGSPVILFSGFVFFSSFLLTSNWIQPIGTIMGERLMYFPALGFNCATAFLLCQGFSRPKWRMLCTLAAGVLIAGYGLRTIGRNADWRNHYNLFHSAIATSPESSLVQSNYATVLLYEKNDIPGAIQHARKALEIRPDDAADYFTLGQACHRAGDLAAAVEAFDSVIRLAPKTSGGADALREKAGIEEAMGRYMQARASYEKLVQWRPADVAASLALARVYLKLGEVALARDTLERCRRLAPNNRSVIEALQKFGTGR